MTGGETDRNQQVCRLALLRQQDAIRNLVRRHGHFHIAFVLRIPFLSHVALNVVRIAVVGSHSDDIAFHELGLNVLLSHHEIARHAPGFADVELVRPVVVVSEFVAGQPEFADLIPQRLWHARLVGQKIEQALGVIDVSPPDLRAPPVAGLRVFPAFADIVR